MRTCDNCGKDISDRRTTAKYCKTCAVVADRNNSKERLKTGVARQTWGDKQYHKNKRAAHNEQGVCCIICGWTVQGMHWGGCNIHHIDYICDGGQDHPNNIAVLCPNCHVLAHQGIITKEELRGIADVARRTRPDLTEIRKLVDNKLRPAKVK